MVSVVMVLIHYFGNRHSSICILYLKIDNNYLCIINHIIIHKWNNSLNYEKHIL